MFSFEYVARPNVIHMSWAYVRGWVNGEEQYNTHNPILPDQSGQSLTHSSRAGKFNRTEEGRRRRWCGWVINCSKWYNGWWSWVFVFGVSIRRLQVEFGLWLHIKFWQFYGVTGPLWQGNKFRTGRGLCVGVSGGSGLKSNPVCLCRSWWRGEALQCLLWVNTQRWLLI